MQMPCWDNVTTTSGIVLIIKDCYSQEQNKHTRALRPFIHRSFNFIDSAQKLTRYSWHINICAHCADGVLRSQWRARAKQHIYIKRDGTKEKRLTSSREQRLWVRIQNPSEAIKNTGMQSMPPDVVGGKWSEGKSTHTLPLCYKQSDNTLVVLHLHLMSVQAARYANVTRMWGVWTIAQPSPSPLGRVCCGVVFNFLFFFFYYLFILKTVLQPGCSEYSEVVGN